MYKVMVVDDEEVVREGIKAKIKWGELGFAPPITAADGREAIDAADEFAPELVITDIYMPFVDGLALAEYLYANHPDIKIIIISGFEEFDFAVRALKSKVRDYILKPVTSAELTELLRKIRAELDEESERRREFLNAKTLLEENGPAIRERFLNRLIKGAVRGSELFRKLDFAGLPSEAGGYAIAVIDADGTNTDSSLAGYGDELLYFCVYNISEELVKEYKTDTVGGAVFQDTSSRTVIIFWGGRAEENEEAIESICGKIAGLLPRTLGFTVTLGVSGLFTDISEISARYSEALDALEYRFIMGGNRVIRACGLARPGISLYHAEEYEERVIKAVRGGGDIEEPVGAFFGGLAASGMTMEGCRTAIQRLLLKIQLLVMRLDIEISEIFEPETDIIAEMYRYKTLGEIKAWVEGVCGNVRGCLSSRRESYQKGLSQKALEYVSENYADPEISVNSVCGYLSISPSYFSSIFKAHTGETFVERLTKTRLQKAKDLLMTTSLKAYEISDKVGYTDSHYFSIIFKKHTGMTPTAYREKEPR